MKVSVTTPTKDREDNLQRTYRLFCSQTYENKELLIHDNSKEPSAFFRKPNDPRVKYFHDNKTDHIGAKRNILAENASGDVLMHFDDDDFYSRYYIKFMLDSLGEADLAKLSSWFFYSKTHQIFGVLGPDRN